MAETRTKRMTILYIAHFDPSSDFNGAKVRLLAMARIIERSGYKFIFIRSTDKAIFTLAKNGFFEFQEIFSDSKYFKREDVVCAIFSWFWIAQHSDGIMNHLRLSSPKVPVVLDTIDAVGIRQMREFVATDFQTPTSLFSYEEEARQVNRADWILAITNEEREYFQSMTNSPVSVVSFSEDEGPDSHQIRKDYTRLASNEKLVTGFFGSRNYANYHSAIKSAHIAWMSGRIERFDLAGSVCDYKELIARLQVRYGSWLNVVGRVDQPFDFYGGVDFTTNILAFGSGIKIKVIETLAYGVPTICNYVAIEGLTRFESLDCGIWRAETAIEYQNILDGPLVSKEMERFGVAIISMMQRDLFIGEVRTFLKRIG